MFRLYTIFRLFVVFTVNTPHSWPHVIAVLSWLIDGIECMNCVDTLTMMYTTNIEQNENEGFEDDIDINLEVFWYFHNRYNYFFSFKSVILDIILSVKNLR